MLYKMTSTDCIIRLIKERMSACPQIEEHRVTERVVLVGIHESWRDWIRENNENLKKLNKNFVSGRDIERLRGLWMNACLLGVRFSVREFVEQRAPMSSIFAQMLDCLNGNPFSQRNRVPKRARPDSEELKYDDLVPMAHESECFREETCTICMDDYEQPTVVPCRHVFCFSCITEWSRINARCPMCRSLLDAQMKATTWNKYVEVEQEPKAEEAFVIPIEGNTASVPVIAESMSVNPKIQWLVDFCR